MSPSFSETLRQEAEARERSMMQERITAEFDGAERELAKIGLELNSLKRTDKQLLDAIEAVNQLPRELQSRFGDRDTALLGQAGATDDARAMSLAILSGARKVLDIRRGKLEANQASEKARRDRAAKALSEFEQ